MDVVTFHHDTVLSDVHMLRPSGRRLMTRLNLVGQPVFVSNFRILPEAEGPEESREAARTETRCIVGKTEEQTLRLDEDGDLEVTHRRRRRSSGQEVERDSVCPVILKQSEPQLQHLDDEEEEEEGGDEEGRHGSGGVIRIEHTMATPLEDVGKQVWRGAFLLADFILSQAAVFRGATVLELGAGTGLTSIVMATAGAKTVYCTDVGEDLLSMCGKNVALNRRVTEDAGAEVKVRRLDWLQHSLCTDADVDFSWTEEEVAHLHDNTSFIIAADLIYDDDLTDGLFRTLRRLCSHFAHSCTIFIALEKRLNYTLRRMDVSCQAYDHFLRRLSGLQEPGPERCGFAAQRLPADFAQFFAYERVDQLELWKVTATRRPASGEGKL